MSASRIVAAAIGLIALAAAPAAVAQPAGIERRLDTYVEGDGYAAFTGSNVADCERRCLADARCRMYELYRPDSRCSLFAHADPAGPSSKAVVGIRQGAKDGDAAPAAGPEKGTRAAAPGCGGPPVVRELTGYNANITTFPAAASARAGQLVEFNAEAVRGHAAYLKQLEAKAAIPEWYWIGANCNKGPDCDALRRKGVPLGSTGTLEWNKTENRIYDLRHPAVVARAEREMERALMAAGSARSDLVFRVDNMHDLDDNRFYDTEHTRTFEELSSITAAWARVEDRLRASGVLGKGQLTGLTAHNNFGFWRKVIESGGRPPVVLRLENPTQFPDELARGAALMQRHRLPFIAIEFEKGHLKGQSYFPTRQQLAAVAGVVSLLVVMTDEDNYEDGRPEPGPGPMRLSWRPAMERCRNEQR